MSLVLKNTYDLDALLNIKATQNNVNKIRNYYIIIKVEEEYIMPLVNTKEMFEKA